MQTSKKEATEYGQKRTPIFTVFGFWYTKSQKKTQKKQQKPKTKQKKIIIKNKTINRNIYRMCAPVSNVHTEYWCIYDG